MDGSDEREFLHAISNPLGTLMFIIDVMTEELTKRDSASPADAIHLQEAMKAIEMMHSLLQQRRAVLVKRGVPSARNPLAGTQEAESGSVPDQSRFRRKK